MSAVRGNQLVHAAEEELLRSEPSEFLSRFRRRAGESDALKIAVARSAEQVGDLVSAASLFDELLRSGDRVIAARANAHLAHIDYYMGNFHRGVQRASASVAFGALPRAEARLICRRTSSH